MSIVERIEKRRLILVLGADEAPSGDWNWEAVRFLTNSEDGSDAAAPQVVSIPATADEVAQHISKAMVDQLASVKAQHETWQAEKAKLEASIAETNVKLSVAQAAVEKATAVAQLMVSADKAWDEQVGPAIKELAGS